MRQALGSAGLMFWLLNQKSPSHFAVCAEIAGTTTVESWRHALNKVQQRHPNFAVGIALDATGNPYVHSVVSARIPLRIVVGGDLRWEPEIERELATPFDAGQAPLVRAVLLHQAHRSVFILVAHHSIADGKSLVFAIRDTLHALSGKLLAPPPPVVSMDAWFASLPGDILGEAAGQDSPLETTDQHFVFRKQDGFGPRVTRRTLTPAVTETLRRRSRSEETTIQCALVTAAAEAARRSSSALRSATIRVSSPIDFRQVIGAEDQVEPLGAGVMIPMQPQAHATFWDAARFAKRIVDPARTPSALAGIMRQMGPFMSSRPSVEDVAGFWAERLGYHLNVSNLGAVPIETCIGDLRVEAFGGPAILIGFEGEQGIGVATANGSLTLLHASHDPLPSFLESMEQLLIAACA